MKTVRMRGPTFKDNRLHASQQQRDAWMERALKAEEALARLRSTSLDDGFDDWWKLHTTATVMSPNWFARYVWQAARRFTLKEVP